MAGSRTRYNAGGAFTNNSAIFVLTSAVSYTSTSALAPTSVPGPPEKYMYKNLKKAIKLALELFVKGQEHRQLQANTAPCEQPLKT